MKNAEQPAFPLSKRVGDVEKSEGGLTKREYFAAMAMQGILVSHPHAGEGYVASQAVNQADTLLAELERQP